MALVNNATGVYSTLNYSYDDPNNQINDFSANTQSHLETIPPIITSWQAQDIAANNVGGYFQNPVSNSIHFMSNTANNLLSYSPIIGDSDSITQLFTNILANCSFLSIGNETYTTQNTITFLYHTDRLSNMRTQADDAKVHIDGTNLPYFRTATQMAKSATYIVNQTDGVANNSIMLGCFTSILEANQVNQLATTLYNDTNAIVNSLSLVPGGEGGGSDYYRSHLSYNTVLGYSNAFANIVSLMTDRESADKAFYVNLKGLIDKYDTTKQLVNMGESEKYLVNNLIGTDKTKSRIN
jgi:hypothetical protein